MKVAPAALAALLMGLPSANSFAQDGRFYGMPRERDLTPFGFSIGPTEIQAIRDLPGENYLLDLAMRGRCVSESAAV